MFIIFSIWVGLDSIRNETDMRKILPTFTIVFAFAIFLIFIIDQFYTKQILNKEIVSYNEKRVDLLSQRIKKDFKQKKKKILSYLIEIAEKKEIAHKEIVQSFLWVFGVLFALSIPLFNQFLAWLIEDFKKVCSAKGLDFFEFFALSIIVVAFFTGLCRYSLYLISDIYTYRLKRYKSDLRIILLSIDA